MTESSSKSLERSLGQDNAEVSLLREQLELLESEMESLRRRMKLLESRAGTPTQNSLKSGAAAAPSAILNKYENPNLPKASPPSAAPGTSAAPSPPSSSSSHHKRRRRTNELKQTTGDHPKRTGRSRRRSRASKIKRQLLFFYGLLIGTALLVVLVLMIFNLFGTEPILGGNSSTSFTDERNDSAEVNIEIDDKPDLEELRRAIESADE